MNQGRLGYDGRELLLLWQQGGYLPVLGGRKAGRARVTATATGL